MAKTARVAVDIGGTFTDLVSIDERGRLRRAKSESTPAALEEAVLTVLGHSGVDPAEVGTFIHGSTVVINAITERRGARTALVTTRGFRDVLEITRANRPDLYNLRYQKPVPFVERSHRLEVTERVSYRGDEIAPLDLEELADVVTALAELNVEAAAVAFLHSWVNPVHEEAAAAYLRASLPGV
jgi:N-methylhydantoinase A